MKLILFMFLSFFITIGMQRSPLQVKQPAPKRDNPNFIRDRKRNIINKPEMPSTWTNRYKQLYDPNWMDYCDPYHCNDFHKPACGLNRRRMKFKWFQSICHVILNNQCSNFRGSLKFDLVNVKFCVAYVMFLRDGCPKIEMCSEEIAPICGQSSVDGHIVIFKNQCYMDVANCRNSTLQEYDHVYMDICEYTIKYSSPEKVKYIQ